MSEQELELARYYEMPLRLRKHYRICNKCGRVVKHYATGKKRPCPYCERYTKLGR